ncbi:urease accessory protein UreE [Moraxella sp. PS-22]|uniref:Urease accessory protein UreE n=1 Tax=Moraxella tetraodonis TaxID=2767221 RepID=A0A9X1UT79_9GAMM|nr:MULTISPECIES: urease accessory protein UreE [Moraxella]MCG8148572.1 urease accessory protein UreE [Moraxella tetraodonis]
MKIYNQRVQQLTDQQQADLVNQQAKGQFLQLDFDTRQRSRFRATQQNGEAVGIDLPRTGTLKDGDVVQNASGDIIQIFAKPQTLTKVTADNAFELMRGAYHLGNRHVPLMLVQHDNDYALYFEPDYVLADMLVKLGLTVSEVEHAFEPETGAYGHSHSHSHAHGHGHDNRLSHADTQSTIVGDLTKATFFS